jgi:hypothetical protein
MALRAIKVDENPCRWDDAVGIKCATALGDGF